MPVNSIGAFAGFNPVLIAALKFVDVMATQKQGTIQQQAANPRAVAPGRLPMTDSGDLAPDKDGWRRLSYTVNGGFIDWGHGLPGSAAGLKQDIDNKRNSDLTVEPITLNGQPAYIVEYGQSQSGSLGPFHNTNGTHDYYVIRGDLSEQQVREAAFGIYLDGSNAFEKHQGSFPWSLRSGGSSFSYEDLTSNAVGFYRAFVLEPELRNANPTWSDSQIHQESENIMRSALGEVSVDESKRIYDQQFPDGIGNQKKHDWHPGTFQSNESPAIPVEYQRYSDEFLNMTAAAEGTTWVRVRGDIPYTDHGWIFLGNGEGKPATEVPVTVDFDSSGKAHLKQRPLFGPYEV